MRALDDSPAVAEVRAALRGEEAWIVGGTVRDALLERPLRDIDIAFGGDPARAARAVARRMRGPAFSLSDEFGTWRALHRADDWMCDVSPLQGATIEEDLRTRDFSVNAMAVPLEGGALLDPTGGGRDLDARRLRMVSPGAYEADPLRVLRLARLVSELGFTVEEATARRAREAAPLLSRPAAERIFTELRRLVVADGVVAALELAEELGMLAVVLPELPALRDVDQSRYHHLDVHGHTMEVLARTIDIERDPGSVFGGLAEPLRDLLDEPLADELTRGQALRFGALLHDVAKPATRGVLPDGRVTFIGHDSRGEEMVKRICARLRTSARLRDYLGALTRNHLVLGFLVHERPLSRRTVHAYLTRCEPVEVEVTLLSCADRLATLGANAGPAIEKHLGLGRELMAEALAWRRDGPPTPLVRGDELARELEVERGPELGRLLGELAAAQFAGEVTTREDALRYARAIREASPS